MNSKESKIEYADDNEAVKKYLRRASLLFNMAYVCMGMFALIAGASFVVEEMSGETALGAIMLGLTALLMVSAADEQKSAWVKTLELRVRELERQLETRREEAEDAT